MALIKCQECGKQVSTNAESCPHCGTTKFSDKPADDSNDDTPKVDSKGEGCLIVLFVLFLLFLGWLLVALFSGTPEVSERDLECSGRVELCKQSCRATSITEWQYDNCEDDCFSRHSSCWDWGR